MKSLYTIAGCNGAGNIMSEQEEIKLFDCIRECTSEVKRKMAKRKAMLGETIVIADANSIPIEIAASEVMNLYTK